MFKRAEPIEPALPPEPVSYGEIALNDEARNAEQSFADNYISTTKYTLLTFVPVRRRSRSLPLLRSLVFWFFCLARFDFCLSRGGGGCGPRSGCKV